MGVQVPDHDLLIQLNTKVDQVLLLQTDLVSRVAKTETRLDQQDVYHASIPLDHFKRNSDWVDGFRSNYKFLLALGGLLIGVLGGLISNLMGKLLHL